MAHQNKFPQANSRVELVLCALHLIGQLLSQTQWSSVAYCIVFVAKYHSNDTMHLHITIYVICVVFNKIWLKCLCRNLSNGHIQRKEVNVKMLEVKQVKVVAVHGICCLKEENNPT